MWLGTVAIRAWKSIFDIAKLLKTTILPMCTVCTLETTLRNLDFIFYRVVISEVST